MTFRNRIVNYGVKPADQFLANPKNARLHPQYQRDVMADALNKIGFIAPVIENAKTGYLVDGHERVYQALAQDNAPVPYVSIELDEDEETYALATFDPITALAEYDAQVLDTLLADVRTDSEHVERMLVELRAEWPVNVNGEPPGDPGAAIHRAEALREKYQVERDQLWIIGRHRVMCGDAYSEDDVSLLLNGEKPDMLHIDPPYGIGIVQPRNGSSAAAIGGAKAWGSTGETKRKGATAVAERNSRAGRVPVQHGSSSRNQLIQSNEYLTIRGDVGRGDLANIIQSNLYPVIEGDDRPFDPALFVDCAPIVIMWGANYYADQLPISSCWLCWDKREGITRNNFADCELAWSNLDQPARVFHHLWNGLHKGSQHGEARSHPTEKPVALFAEIGKMFCDDDLWLDLFAGTGAQVVAAQQIGTRCYAMEIEPLYIAVILDRLQRMGLEPRRA